ncbi:MAG: hypothetical protein ACFIN5_01310 [Candidatus Walczuchella monophlebidarum]
MTVTNVQAIVAEKARSWKPIGETKTKLRSLKKETRFEKSDPFY